MEGAQTLERGIQLLNILAQSPNGRTVTELARDLGVGRTVVYRLVVSLERSAMIRRDEASRYHLGLGVVALVGDLFGQLRSAAKLSLQALANTTESTAVLVTADALDSIVLAVAEPAGEVRHLAARVGDRQPLKNSAAGQLLLATREGRAHLSPEAALVPAGTGLEIAVEAMLLGAPTPEIRPAVLAAAGEITASLR